MSLLRSTEYFNDLEYCRFLVIYVFRLLLSILTNAEETDISDDLPSDELVTLAETKKSVAYEKTCLKEMTGEDNEHSNFLIEGKISVKIEEDVFKLFRGCNYRKYLKTEEEKAVLEFEKEFESVVKCETENGIEYRKIKKIKKSHLV